VEIRSKLAHLDAADGGSTSAIGWAGTTMSIKAIHVYRLEPLNGGTKVRSQESWEGFVARLLKGYSRKAIDRAIRNLLVGLKQKRNTEQPAALPSEL
jgi:hypothetical protein